MSKLSRYLPWLLAGAGGLAAYRLIRRRGSRSSTLVEGEPTGARIVVLGAGFAGLAAARKLAARAANAQIRLIDQNNYHLFTPPLFQVATSAIDPYNIAFPVRTFAAAERITFQQGTVEGIDLDARQVRLSDGTVPYDYLIVALGSTTNFFGDQATKQNAFPLKSLEDAVTLRHHVLGVLERASQTSDPVARRALLSFAMVGGGSTGVETAAALADFLRRVVPSEFPRLDPRELRVVVVQSRGKLLGHMSDRLAAIALAKLRALGVEVWLNTRASVSQPGLLSTQDGRTVSAQTIIWTAGVRASDVTAQLNVAHGHAGSLAVDEFLRLHGHPEVYAAGDNAAISDPRTGHGVPLLAQAAIQEGEAAANNLIRARQHQPLVAFHYRSLGNAVSLGRTEGVVEAGPITIDGVIGGLGWKLAHLVRMADLRNQLGTALDWSLNLIREPDTTRLALSARPSPASPAATPGAR